VSALLDLLLTAALLAPLGFWLVAILAEHLKWRRSRAAPPAKDSDHK